MVNKKVTISIVVLFVAIAGFFLFFNNGPGVIIQVDKETNIEPEEILSKNIFDFSWTDLSLKNINTQEEFKISDFSGKPILIESFAVWCPTCTSQQKKIKELHDELGDSVISISLDTDPNEDESKVIGHVSKYGFDWIYVISPVELTKALIDEFGIDFVNAPSAPMALICPDGTYKQLRSGVKSSSELKEEIDSCNN